ncbi:MAG TPA: polysaccharide biosynthesis protein [Nevskiaceae bacterium]|nr:polysaccharide biosynthesis protein [Nevskiaceae bacterium]
MARNIHPLLQREEMIFTPPDVAGKRILVTGSRGSIGTQVGDRLKELGAIVEGFDVADGFDVSDLATCMELISKFRPDAIVHLAAEKYATHAESDPYNVVNLNAHGTHYLCSTAQKFGVKTLVAATTCKSIQPETVYGASKLISDRIVLNHGYTVGRFFNVVETAGNVFEIWGDRIKNNQELHVTPCRRYFISTNEAVGFMVHLLGVEPGRYAPFPGEPVLITEMAERFAPGYPTKVLPPRRGDRLVEPLIGNHEAYILKGNLMVIDNPHDHPATDAEDGMLPAFEKAEKENKKAASKPTAKKNAKKPAKTSPAKSKKPKATVR